MLDKRASHPLVVASAYGRSGASTRVRLLGWLDHLGIEAVHWDYLGTSEVSAKTLKARPASVLAAEAKLRFRARFDRVERLVLSRVATPLSRGAPEVQMLKRAQWGTYDFDDALMWDPRRSPTHRIFSKAEVWRRSVSTADCTVAGSEVLANFASEFSQNVVMIPSCIEPSDYMPKRSYALSESPTIVWLGSPSNETYLLDIAPALLSANEQFGARLRVVSAGSASLGPLDGMVDRVPWSPETFPRELASADLAIAPLRDTPLARGKCAYKSLQYAATGLPIIGTPVGANANALSSFGAWAPTTVDDWKWSLENALTSTEGARMAKGEKARSTVVAQYSYGVWAANWMKATGLSH